MRTYTHIGMHTFTHIGMRTCMQRHAHIHTQAGMRVHTHTHTHTQRHVDAVCMLTRRTVLVDPLRVTVGARNTAVSSVDQRLLFVGRENGKLLALRQLLTEGLKPPVLVFVATKVHTQRGALLRRARACWNTLFARGVLVCVCVCVCVFEVLGLRG